MTGHTDRELSTYPLNDLRAAMQLRLVDNDRSEGLTTKQRAEILTLLFMVGDVIHGYGEITETNGDGDWSELTARSYRQKITHATP